MLSRDISDAIKIFVSGFPVFLNFSKITNYYFHNKKYRNAQTKRSSVSKCLQQIQLWKEAFR